MIAKGARMSTRTERLPAILVVEDDPVLSVVLQRHLRKLAPHYEVVHVSDAPATLAQLDKRSVPLVITDYHLLASINGLKLTAAIRRRSPETRIVLITAYATAEVEQAAAAEGVEFYLPKPFLLEDLTQIVSTVLSWWEEREQTADH
jgi:two-component system, response regulator, stage 0 sporulation protein F